MSDSYIKGNFEHAIQTLIMRLVNSNTEFASMLLSEWDNLRGDDWYTNTRKQEFLEAKSKLEKIIFKPHKNKANNIRTTLEETIK